MFKFFKLTDESKINDFGVRVFRIQAIEDFYDVRKGQKGGFVESENNIEEYGWLEDNAEAFGNAVISGNAVAKENAKIYGNAKMSGNSMIRQNAHVCDNAQLSGFSRVVGNACARENAQISDYAWVDDQSVISGNGKACGRAQLFGSSKVTDRGVAGGDAVLKYNDEVSGNTIFLDNPYKEPEKKKRKSKKSA